MDYREFCNDQYRTVEIISYSVGAFMFMIAIAVMLLNGILS